MEPSLNSYLTVTLTLSSLSSVPLYSLSAATTAAQHTVIKINTGKGKLETSVNKTWLFVLFIIDHTEFEECLFEAMPHKNVKIHNN